MIIAEGRLTLRWMEPHDLPQLVDLFRCCYSSEAWTMKDFETFRDKATRKNLVKCLCDEAGVVYGAILLSMHDPELCRIRRVAVWPDYRRMGLATFMLHTICGPRSHTKRQNFAARVRETNLPAIKLLRERMGFVFDQKKRERDPARDCDYYEFTFVKPKVATTVTV